MVSYTYIVLNIKIGPFAAEQLHHRHVAPIGSPDQRRPTSL